jgi:DNA polymerase III alpha subunit
MLELSNRKIDDYGNVVFQVKDLYELIVQGHDVLKYQFADGPDTQQLIESSRTLDNEELIPQVYVPPTEPVDACMDRYRNNWLIPEPFKSMNVRDYLNELCSGTQECARVDYEMNVFEKYELEDMLRSLVYMVDTFRQNNVVWGVGRGSSVSSFVLYLIGIHRVNSITYDLDFDEFLN